MTDTKSTHGPLALKAALGGLLAGFRLARKA
jgi:hypothetical protein